MRRLTWEGDGFGHIDDEVTVSVKKRNQKPKAKAKPKPKARQAKSTPKTPPPTPAAPAKAARVAVQSEVVNCQHRWLERWLEKKDGRVIRLSGAVCIKCGTQQVPIADRGVVVVKEK